MLVLGLVRPTRAVLSWDEIATADVARRSVSQIWLLAHHIDGVFLPYYLFMHLWTTVVGDSVLDLRFPSIVAMAGAVALAGELGRRLSGPAVGLVTGLLLCLLPNLSRYAAEARPYAFACFFATLALLLLYRVLDAPSRLRWAVYGGAVLGLGLSHVVALTTLVAHLVILLMRTRRAVLPWILTVAVALVPLLPLLWWGTHQRQAQLHWMPPLTGATIYQFPAELTGTAPTAWLLLGLALLAAITADRRSVELTVAGFGPPLVVLALAAAGTSFWVNRYLLFALMPIAMLAATTLVRAATAPRWQTRGVRLLAAFCLVGLVAVPGEIEVRGPTVKNGSNYRKLAALIRSGQQPGDVLVYQAGRTMRAGVEYYLRNDTGRPRDALVSASAAAIGSLSAREYPDPVVRLAGTDRIWLVLYARRTDPLTGRPDLASFLREGYHQAGVWTGKRATLALYVAD
ncbi:hypothetical protein Ate02nite_86570 [Paractinoplanes tereljensis]|uniref:Glycosyltransferase RgtA/B/C/D-like domain-containing protein n=2 Tax=Paractinoplanes tereljensis TaxID=571912 RepID=A0A919TZI8_9ACTN|nr:hypothetical protein Ate02nite_86570 [Actinoplanes tereljensis]